MWHLQEAKQRLSELIRRAQTDGPQTVTKHGSPVAMVVGIEDYRKLSGQQDDFKTFLLAGPDFELLQLDRTRDRARKVEL